MTALTPHKNLFIILLSVLQCFTNSSLCSLAQSNPEDFSQNSQTTQDDLNQPAWYTYNHTMREDSFMWSQSDHTNSNQATKIDENQQSQLKFLENKSRTKSVQETDGANSSLQLENSTNRPYNGDEIRFNTNVNSDTSANNPKRISEIKCEEYGQAVGKKGWALTLVGTEHDGIPLNDGRSKCGGLHTPLIVGGTKAQSGEFPHMAALGWPNEGQVDYLCGGTLISERWILTACHCTRGQAGSPSVVRLGDHNLGERAEGQIVEIKRIQRHPTYKPPAMYADIALVELKIPVTFTDHIKPACLYPEYDATPAQAWATGWGGIEIGEHMNEALLKARLDILDNVACALRHNSSVAVPRGIVPSMVCAGDVTGGWHSDTCQGDSGGPLQIVHPIISCLYQVVGITSFGKLCALRDFPGIYTRVSHYLDWIERIVWPEKMPNEVINAATV
ncbi:serine protease snake-like [Diprion similis]|uniref:serine protease snake-like n=1 Tax=Diprion similis TaxID=362088 RepID=UPI001EF81283|nr:serine protease snake-like [Diprion similis]